MRRLKNPDERTRNLERAAAAGDVNARRALGLARARAGQCSDCATVLPTAPPPGSHVVPVAIGESGVRRCIACAAELDLALVKARRPVAGYLTAVNEHVSSLTNRWPRTAGAWYAVTNFMGFPLLAVTELAGISGGYTGRGLAYSAVDTDQLPWYGRAKAVGMITRARPKSQERAEPWILRGRKALAEAQAEWLMLAREDPTGALLDARRTRQNPDESLRRLERAASGGGPEDRARLLREQARAGMKFTWGGEPLGQWEEVTEEDFDYSLNVLPPKRMGGGGHVVGELYSSTRAGENVWTAFQIHGGRYWRALVTLGDLPRYIGELRTKKNPDENPPPGTRFRVTFSSHGQVATATASYKGKRVGHARAYERLRDWAVTQTRVAPELRRKGIATELYSRLAAKVCEEKGKPLVSEGYQRSAPASHVWKSLPGVEVWRVGKGSRPPELKADYRLPCKKNPDEGMRRAERRGSGGDVHEEAGYLRSRLRARTISIDNLRLAALLGHAPAQLAIDYKPVDPPYIQPDDVMIMIAQDNEWGHRMAALWARACVKGAEWVWGEMLGSLGHPVRFSAPTEALGQIQAWLDQDALCLPGVPQSFEHLRAQRRQEVESYRLRLSDVTHELDTIAFDNQEDDPGQAGQRDYYLMAEAARNWISGLISALSIWGLNVHSHARTPLWGNRHTIGTQWVPAPGSIGTRHASVPLYARYARDAYRHVVWAVDLYRGGSGSMPGQALDKAQLDVDRWTRKIMVSEVLA